ncbi:MAG: non-homologous end-joining DNA ligase [Nocardioides sp.]
MSEVMVEVGGRTLKLTNLEKVLYPATGTTKGEVINYYARIAPVLLPHLAGRAVTRIRWPNGVHQPSFFEKNVPAGTPSWVRTVRVPTSGSRWGSAESSDARGSRAGELVFPIADDLATLTWLGNLAALELHVHQWTVGPVGEIRPPDRVVIDLDPGEPAGLHECCQVALMVQAKLAEFGLAGKAVTSGSKGLHVYAALPGSGLPGRGLPEGELPQSVDSTSALAKQIADELQATRPDLVTAQMTKSRRAGKVFLDWSQNVGAKTTISPYSLRGREYPRVATPVSWTEVEGGAGDEFGLAQFRFEEVVDRVADVGDLFGD